MLTGMKNMLVKNMLAFVVFALAVPGIRSATAAQDVPPAPVAAEEALGGFGGSLELPKPGLLFQPCLKPNGWTARFSVEDRFTKPAQGEHTYFFVPDADRDGERLAGTATFTPTPDGGVAAAWSVARSAAHPSARAAVGVDFRLPQYAEAVCETDAGTVAFTAGAAFGDVFNKDVRHLAVKTAEGGRVRAARLRRARARAGAEGA